MSAELIAELQTWIKGIKSTVAQYPSYAHAESGYDNAQMRKIADVMERASQRLAAAQQDESRWISVSERLPDAEDGTRWSADVLVSYESSDINDDGFAVGHYDVAGNCWYRSPTEEEIIVTHWMPIVRPSAPDRPQEVEKP